MADEAVGGGGKTPIPKEEPCWDGSVIYRPYECVDGVWEEGVLDGACPAKNPRFLPGIFLSGYLIISCISLYGLGLAVVILIALAKSSAPACKRFLSEAYKIATVSPFLTFSPSF